MRCILAYAARWRRQDLVVISSSRNYHRAPAPCRPVAMLKSWGRQGTAWVASRVLVLALAALGLLAVTVSKQAARAAVELLTPILRHPHSQPSAALAVHSCRGAASLPGARHEGVQEQVQHHVAQEAGLQVVAVLEQRRLLRFKRASSWICSVSW